ncbi:hypothetical protein [Marinobacter sp. tcs-11]|uniref:hypothetical protein n=1 Tax=Marinobacter sp. tcs-11 TaxID=1742860 RepID=UPI00257B4BD9|nr:hypothetical protein [Marinobacter sp. tcs-11]
MNNVAAETMNWQPHTKDDHPIQTGDRLWWSDLNGAEKPRWVEVKQIDLEEGLIFCKDQTDTNLMTVPEELTTQAN